MRLYCVSIQLSDSAQSQCMYDPETSGQVVRCVIYDVHPDTSGQDLRNDVLL